MHKKMKSALDGLGALAKAYLPDAFKKVLLDMAEETDRLRAEVDKLRSSLNDDGK